MDVPYLLSKYNPHPQRFYLTATGPETRDTELGEALALAREANRYTFATLPSTLLGTGTASLERKALWSQIKEDRAVAATSVHSVLRVVDNLEALLAPILPHTAQRLHKYLGHDGQLFGTQQAVEYQEEARHGGLRSHWALTYDHGDAIGTHSLHSVHAWAKSELLAPLFKKLDESVIEEEYACLEG